MTGLSAFLTLALSATGASDETPLDRGIRLLSERKYETALEVLESATKESPKDALTNLWYGIALEADGQPHEAMAAWRLAFGHEVWEPFADTLRGYSWWRMGDFSYAKRTFEEALVNLKDGKKVRFLPAQDALSNLASGATVPPVSAWVDSIRLREATAKVMNAPTESAVRPPKPAVTPSPEEKAPPTGANVKPQAGKWIGKRTKGGYNDGKIMFTVSPDGKRITEIVFVGHWYDRDRRHTEPVTTGPEGAYALRSGGWGGLRTNAKAGFGWEFEGRLLSARRAVGKFRGYAAGVYDTGTVEWTASPAR